MAKKVSLYGILTALCLIFGYIESLIPLSFIAPGIKLGLSNSIALILVAKKDIKGAFAVNIARILVSSLLFSTPFSLLFSLTSGIMSILIMWLLSGKKSISVIGFSIVGAVIHNTTQTIIACIIFGKAVFYYFPLLLISAAISGAVIGFLCEIILKKLKTNIKL